MKLGLVLFFSAACLLSACQSWPTPAAGNGATFHEVVAPPSDISARRTLGASVGKYLDRRLARDLDPRDQALHDGAAERALWSKTKGYGATWRDPKTGATGMIKPLSPVERTGAVQCRKFHDDLHLRGEPEFGVDGTACLNGTTWTVDF